MNWKKTIGTLLMALLVIGLVPMALAEPVDVVGKLKSSMGKEGYVQHAKDNNYNNVGVQAVEKVKDSKGNTPGYLDHIKDNNQYYTQQAESQVTQITMPELTAPIAVSADEAVLGSIRGGHIKANRDTGTGVQILEKAKDTKNDEQKAQHIKANRDSGTGVQVIAKLKSFFSSIFG